MANRRKQRPSRPWQTDASRLPSVPELATRAHHRGRSCGTKVGHGSEAAAEFAANEHLERFGEAKQPYECGFCGRWHVGAPR